MCGGSGDKRPKRVTVTLNVRDLRALLQLTGPGSLTLPGTFETEDVVPRAPLESRRHHLAACQRLYIRAK